MRSPGVRESAVVAEKQGARELVHAVLVLEPGASGEAIVSEANARLEAHQRIKGWSVWPGEALPRTSGTGKLKRGEVAAWVRWRELPPAAASDDSVEDVIRKYAGGRAITGASSLDDLGLSSLDRIQLLMELEKRTGAPIDEASFANAKTVADLAHAEAGGGTGGRAVRIFRSGAGRPRLARATGCIAGVDPAFDAVVRMARSPGWRIYRASMDR